MLCSGGASALQGPSNGSITVPTMHPRAHVERKVSNSLSPWVQASAAGRPGRTEAPRLKRNAFGGANRFPVRFAANIVVNLVFQCSRGCRVRVVLVVVAAVIAVVVVLALWPWLAAAPAVVVSAACGVPLMLGWLWLLCSSSLIHLG